MTQARGGGHSSSATKIVSASVEDVYRAFVEPDALLAWLPPADMTGTIHTFDARVGGGYQMSLFYPPGEQGFPGKTSEKEDRVEVRFVELTPPRRIVEAVRFVTDDPQLMGEMIMTITFESVADGTRVEMAFDDLPPGLRPEDNDTGARMSLEQLARWLDK